MKFFFNKKKMPKVLVTGSAGFIGFHLTKKLLDEGYDVVGLDNINDYYDVNLKYGRLDELGISRNSIKFNKYSNSVKFNRHRFIKLNLEDKDELFKIFNENKFDIVINLAAQAGVRYSIENPDAYIQSNIVGFFNILEACRNYPVEHLIYASSSSVYGMNSKIPFSTDDKTDNPVSLYAATKKSNELMAYTYSHLYNIKTTGLRFFTVYGPWGRPDMAPILFTKALFANEPIKVFNNGRLERDFTYIDDIIQGMLLILENRKVQKYSLYNIGNSKPINLLEFINILELTIGKSIKKEFVPMQKGDVFKTWADCSPLENDFGYEPKKNINKGVGQFVKWYLEYYEKNNINN